MKAGVDHIGVSVVFYCHDGKGNFAMAMRGPNCRDEHGTWDPGAGAVDFGENVEAVVRREVDEEYCATILKIEFLGFRDVHRIHEGKPTH